MTYPIALNEADRLAALDELKIVGSGPEAAFTAICQEAARFFEVPVAVISLVGKDQQFCKAHVGASVDPVPRELTFCTHAILNDEPLIVPDATRDERFAANPLVTSEPGIRFYAGAPLFFGENIRLGTLCLVDTKPRTMTAADAARLERLAERVSGLLWQHDARVNPDAYAIPETLAGD